MAFNMWKVKKWSSLFMVGFLPLMFFLMFIMVLAQPFLYAIIGGLMGIFLGVIMANQITKHPFTDMLAGDGLLLLDISSTGVIRPILCKVMAPFLTAKIKGKQETTLFDREIVHQMGMPQSGELGFKGIDENGFKHYDLKIKQGDETKITYAFEHFPTLIYNSNMDAFISKEALAKMETEAVVKHTILYLKKKVEELTHIMRDFARYVIESTRPKTGLQLPGGWILWLAVAAIVVLLAIFGLPALQNLMSGASQSISSVASG